VDSIVGGKDYVPVKAQKGSIGVPESPIFPKDATDRNRTSPFAFTGNKFEFRMLGSQANVADPNIVLNTIVADAFESFADELEGAKDLEKAADKIIARELKAHYRIIYNLDGYGPDWEPEAMKRGLLNNKNTADAAKVLFEEKNIEVFVKQGVYTREEAIARGEIQLENYTKMINIEALTMLEMAKQDIIPAISNYVADLCSNVATKQAVSEKLPCATEKALIEKLATLNDQLFEAVNKLEGDLAAINKEDVEPASQAMAHTIVPDMEAVRKIADKAETLTAEEYWPYSSYFDLLYSVK
jgi:glutamine synthetase